MTLGEKLRQLRQDKDLTQPQLADAIGIEQSYVSKLENGKYVPSAEIFDRILGFFVLSVGEFVDGLDHGSRQRLRQIPVVSDYYQRQQRLIFGSRRLWLIACSALFAVGAGLIYAGTVKLLVPGTVYEYQSKGIVLEGEPKDVFTRMQRVFTQDSYKFHEERTDVTLLRTRTYRGSVFNAPVDGGSRTYHLIGQAQVDSWVNKAIGSLGVMLAALGFAGFALERKLARFP